MTIRGKGWRWVLAAGVGLTGLTGCDRSVAPSGTGVSSAGGAPSPAEAAKAIAEEDAEVEKELNEKKADARTWLANPKNVLWKGDRKEIQAFVEKAHQLGAKNVWVSGALDAKELGGNEMAAVFVVEMPADKAAWAGIIGAYNAAMTGGQELDKEDLEELTVREQGQKYVVMNLDL